MTYKKIVISTLLIFVALQFTTIVFAKDSLDYSTYSIDYSKLSAKKYKETADYYFIRSQKSPSAMERRQAEMAAIAGYNTLSKIEPSNVYPFVQLGRIYANKKADDLAKENYSRALCLDSIDPYANYFYAEYFYGKRKYRQALKYYLKAYNNGYSEVNKLRNRMGEIYDKLGDSQKAKEFGK
ncbi:MAG: hypothetical protein LKG27_04055 [Clostridiaceae bacterium]|jgi:predicted Zn-dependent protease|nr:hypothetical protein [Clostridiaceae bacterium]